MKFKQWINELSTAQLKALACQNGCKKWNVHPRRELCVFLIKSASTREQFRDFYA